jgi:cation transport ATPase
MTRLRIKRFVFILLFAGMAIVAPAQVLSATVGVNGLTCSQCSRSVEMQLRKLSFVKNVNMNLEHTQGTLQFKEGSKVDFSQIAKAIKDAGFSVRFLSAAIDMSHVEMQSNIFHISNGTYILEGKEGVNKSVHIFMFNGSPYSAAKQKDKAPNQAKNEKGPNVYRVSLLS